MNVVELIKMIITFLCAPAELYFDKLFAFAPDVLKLMCVSMLVATIGKNLNFYEQKIYMILKGLLLVWFLLYLAYIFDYLAFTEESNTLDWFSLGLSIIAPICVLIVWTIAKSWLKQKLPIELYYIAMIFYFLIGVWWAIFKADLIIFDLFLLYEGLLLISVYICSKISKGVLSAKDDDFWKRVLMVLKIIGFGVLVAIIELIVLPLDPENRLFPFHVEIWAIGLGGIVLFGLLSIYYFHKDFQKFFILLMLGSESLLFVDIEDFLMFFETSLGIFLFMLIIFTLALILYVYTKRAKAVGISLLIALFFSICFVLLTTLNDEIFIENWILGLWFTIVFIVLYLLPPGKLWTIIKKVHLMMILFWLSVFLFDFNDFKLLVIQVYF